MILSSAIRLGYQVVSFLAVIVVTRLAGLEEFGKLSVVISTTVLIALCASLGIPTEMLRMRLSDRLRFSTKTYGLIAAIIFAVIAMGVVIATTMLKSQHFLLTLLLLASGQVVMSFLSQHFKAQQRIYEHDFSNFGIFPISFLLGAALASALCREEAPTADLISLCISIIYSVIVLGTLLLLRRKHDKAELDETRVSPQNLRNFATYYTTSLASLGVLHMSILFMDATFSATDTGFYALGVRLFGVLLLPFNVLVFHATRQIVSAGMGKFVDAPRGKVLALTILGVCILVVSTPGLEWLMSSEIMPAVMIAAILAAGIPVRVMTFATELHLQFRLSPAMYLVFVATSIIALVIASIPSAMLGVYYFAICMSIYNFLPGVISFFYMRTGR